MNDNNSKSFNERLGRNIRAARLLQGKKLEEVADRLPVTYQQLQRYEAGIDGPFSAAARGNRPGPRHPGCEAHAAPGRAVRG